jgi:ribonuclease T1
MKRGQWLVLAALLLLAWQVWQRAHVGLPQPGAPFDNPRIERPQFEAGFPREAAETLQLIQRGGPFPYDRDGVVFGNFERRLPQRPRGYYHEYTVPTPGARNRGARRIIAGGRPPSEFWYTGDHYESFTRLDPEAMR